MNQNAGLTSRARQFSRRLSYGITKALRDWQIGKNLNFDDKNAWEIKNPEKIRLPKSNLSDSFVFTSDDYFFAYPNNYNHYVSHYKDTFQHGGISMEEIMIPFIELSGRG